MHFYKASESAYTEIEDRRNARKNLLPFGIQFLDDALLGIMPNDLVLIGAPSAIGKTQLCVIISNAILMAGKRVHYIALEAEPMEIERRIKYRIMADMFYADQNRPRNIKLMYRHWKLGDYADSLAQYEETTAKLFASGYENLKLRYKTEDFGIAEFIMAVTTNADETDVIIVDHVNYFDLDDDNENRAMRLIAKTARSLALEMGKPIILVAHLRKRDRGNPDLCADMEEFHGSSDLFKIATRVVTISPGAPTHEGNFETFMRIPKNRIDGGVNRFIGRLTYNPRTESYAKEYRIGLATATRESGFTELDRDRYPEWAKFPSGVGSCGDSVASIETQKTPEPRRPETHAAFKPKSPWERPAGNRFPASDD